MTKLISLERLGEFLTGVKAWLKPIFDKLFKKTWKGTQAEFEVALAKGEIDESTIIVITDMDEPTVYMFCTESDIKAMFPQYM